MTDMAGTFKSPRFLFAAAVFLVATVGFFMGNMTEETWKWAAGGAVFGYMLNNGIKGILVKK